jgi:mRNA-degrading endonuclease toxin of MazEF toxin-antitoxin module
VKQQIMAEANRWEIEIPKPFLKKGAFHLQQIQSVSLARLERKIGSLTDDEWGIIIGKLHQRISLK